MSMTGRIRRNDAGIALVLVMTVVLALAVVATPFVLSMLLQERCGTLSRYESQADYGAEGAKNFALWRLMYSLDPIERRFPTGLSNSYYWDTAQEFDIRLDDATLTKNAKMQDPKGSIWGLSVQDEQGKLNVKSAPLSAIQNVQQMVDSRVVGVKDFLTQYSGRDASWVCPQRIRGMGNVLPAQASFVGANGLYLDRPEIFGVNARVRVTKPGAQPFESKVSANYLLGNPNGIEFNPGIPPAFVDGVVEVEYRHPININTARRETLIAMFEGLQLWDPQIGGVAPDSLIRRTDAVRLANAFHHRGFRRLEDFGIALAQQGLTLNQFKAVAFNAVCPTHAYLMGAGTVPVCFKSYDVYTIEALASMNNPAGAEMAGRGFREVVSVAAPAVLTRTAESQLDFDLMLMPLAIAAPQNNNAAYLGGGYPFGGRVTTFPNMIPTSLPVVSPSGAPIGPSDVALKPQQKSGTNEAYVQLYAARDQRGISGLEQQLQSWPNRDPRDHFDDSQEGKMLKGTAHTYPWGQVFTFNYDINQPPQSPDQETADIAAGGMEVWVRFDTVNTLMQIFDIREQDATNRLTLRVENGEAILTAADSVIGDKNDQDPINNGVAEVRQPFVPAKDTWYHFGAYWKGTRYAQLALLVDGFAHPQQKFSHMSPEGTKIMTTLGQAMAQNAGSIALKDDSWLPNYLTPLLIGDEIVLYDRSAGTLLRGARGTQPTTHPQGATVSIWGYSSRVRGASVTVNNYGPTPIQIPYDRISKGGGTLSYTFGMNPQAQMVGDKQDTTVNPPKWYVDPTQNQIGVIAPNITDFPDQGYITIEDEVIFYTGRSTGGLGGMPPSSAKFTGCVRGLQGTTAVRHDNNPPVRMWCVPVTNYTNYMSPTIIQVGDEWFGPVWKDQTKTNFWIPTVNNGKPLPLRRGNPVFGSIPGTHNAGDNVIPTFMAKESDPQAPQNRQNMGRNDWVTVVDAMNFKERARVRNAGLPPPQGQPQAWPGDYRIPGGGQIAAFENNVSKDYVLSTAADQTYLRVLKFPSGELLGMQFLQPNGAASNQLASFGPADVTIDEVKFFASRKEYLLAAQQIGASDNTVGVNRAPPAVGFNNVTYRPHLMKIGDEYIGFGTATQQIVSGLRRGYLGSNADVHDLGDPIFSLIYVPVSTLVNDVTATDPSLLLLDPLPGHADRYTRGYVLVDNELMLFEWNGGKNDGKNLGMPVKWDGTTGLYRGMFGTTAMNHTATTALVYGIPWRYYDTYKPQEFDSTMAYFQWSTKMDLANWRTLSWKPDPQLKDPLIALHCLVRFDGKGEFFDRPGISDKVLLQEFLNPAGNKLNRIGHQNEAGQLDVRFYVEYKPGSFDSTQPWNAMSWKRTPKILELEVEYDRPLQTLYHEDR